MSADHDPQDDEGYIRNMRGLSTGPYIAPRASRRERFKSSEHTKAQKTKDQIRKARKRQRKNRRQR